MKGVYCIKNKINSKLYIGSSNNIDVRISTHFRNLKENKHHNQVLQNSYNKYGKHNFTYEILEIVNDEINKEELLLIEQKYIDKYDFEMLFNINRITNSGGAEALKKPSYLIDLEGKIIEEFESLIDISKYLNCSQIGKDRYNNSKIIFKKYRIVTKEFYENNLKLILSWKKNAYKKDDFMNYYKFDEYNREYIVFDNDEIIAKTKILKQAISISKAYAEYLNENK